MEKDFSNPCHHLAKYEVFFSLCLDVVKYFDHFCGWQKIKSSNH